MKKSNGETGGKVIEKIMAVLVGKPYLSYIHKAKSGGRSGESEELLYGDSAGLYYFRI